MFAMRYLKDMSTTRSRLRGMGPLIAAGYAVHQHSLTGVCVMCTFLPILLWVSLWHFHYMSNFPSNPILSLPYLDLLTVGGRFCATLYCSGVFHGYWYLKVLKYIYLATYFTRLLACTNVKCLARTLKWFTVSSFPHIGQY